MVDINGIQDGEIRLNSSDHRPSCEWYHWDSV